MRRGVATAVTIVAVLAAAMAGAGLASADRFEVGNVVLIVDSKVKPKKLPKMKRAPVSLNLFAQMRTHDGARPPGLQHATISFDEQLALRTRGLKRCRAETLLDTTSKQAKQICGKARVGKGEVDVRVDPPGEPSFVDTARVFAFNGTRMNGNPSVVIHAQLRVPHSQTVVLPIEITKARGVYGHEISTDIPPIAGGDGAMTRFELKLNRRWKQNGKRHSYLTGHCRAGFFATYGTLLFDQDSMAEGSVLENCRVRR